MARIKVLGGTGYAGAAVVREAARRGHQVTSYSRRAPAETVDGVEYVTGSVTDPAVLTEAVRDADVVYEAVSPRGDMAGKMEGVADELIRIAAAEGVRLGVMGGASSLHISPGGPLLFDVNPMTDDVRPEIETGLAVFEALKQAPSELDWFYVSPAAEFGAWMSTPPTGSYRISDDVLLTNDDGHSVISADDLALAVLDEIEQPKHRRKRFHAAL
jgi:putative NADH-flavin reductase